MIRDKKTHFQQKKSHAASETANATSILRVSMRGRDNVCKKQSISVL
jgi:hypothetical protein